MVSWRRLKSKGILWSMAIRLGGSVGRHGERSEPCSLQLRIWDCRLRIERGIVGFKPATTSLHVGNPFIRPPVVNGST